MRLIWVSAEAYIGKRLPGTVPGGKPEIRTERSLENFWEPVLKALKRPSIISPQRGLTIRQRPK
jgi:hypothetical protein